MNTITIVMRLNLFRKKSRKYLESFGYKLIVDNISPDDDRPYEDWWVHPDLVHKKIIDKMVCVDGKTKKSLKIHVQFFIKLCRYLLLEFLLLIVLFG